MPDVTDTTARTIAVRASGIWRLRRLTVEYPSLAVNDRRRSHYDAALARELLSRTGEIPFSRRGLLAVLTEYRRALASLAAEPAKIGDAGSQAN
jgi:hypothetical protein